jgi:hypothetical protein
MRWLSSSSARLTWWSSPTRTSHLTCCERILNVLNILEVCCKCFYIDVVKVDRDVAYVAMAVHDMFASVCFKYFICFFDISYKCVYLNVAHAISFKCFPGVLKVFQVFWTYVVSVSSRFCKSRSSIAHVFQVFCKCFRRMLQAF